MIQCSELTMTATVPVMTRNRHGSWRSHRVAASAGSWQEIHFSLQLGDALELDVECGAYSSQFESQPRNTGVESREFLQDGC